jgi:hypothetical protein
MITLANALTAALAYLRAQGAGYKITVPIAAWEKSGENVEAWCMRRNLIYERNGRTVTLEIDTTARI